MEDVIRVLRIVEYVGPRSRVEETISRSLQGGRSFNGLTIRAATIGNYPEVLQVPTCASCGMIMYAKGNIWVCDNCGDNSLPDKQAGA